MSLSKQLADMQRTLSLLTEEFQALQSHIANLEAENEWLRKQAAPAVTQSQSDTDGLRTLQKLYDDGIPWLAVDSESAVSGATKL